ncbi:MAG: DNA primase [Patescibacteria group bacterium]|nr:DNA primase [Patescibacteria group bacterium]
MADTQSIKDRVDVVQLIQEYLPLKKSGANWKAPCPFHHEKTPSFMVHPEKQIWHCFGCQKGGDIFTFVQEMEGLDFPEALKLLADRAGIKLENNFQNEINKSQKNRIVEINAKAAYFFHRFLMDMPTAAPARDYLFNRRGLTTATAEQWQIGYIPDQWELLTQYLLKKGCGIDDLVASGLTIKNEERRSHYDRFRGRIMFPIADAHGNIVGFTGRILVEKENSGGKYVNTPQTLVYDKSRVLYGLDKAKKEIKSKDLAVIVEGQMDVIACHETGMSNVVAASGTALTEEQVRLLKRYSNNIAIAFDADSAGENAAKRGIDVAMAGGMNIRVIQIPAGAGKDADECVRKNSQVWFDTVERATGVMEWYFKNVFAVTDLNNPKSKQTAANTLLAEIAKIPFAVERESWLKKLAEALGVDVSVLHDALKKALKAPAQSSRGGSAFSGKARPGEAPTAPVEVNLSGSQRSRLLVNEFWSLAVKYPGIFTSLFSYLKPEYFADPPWSALYEFYQKQYNNNAPIEPNDLSKKILNDQGEDLIDLLYMQAEKDHADFNEEAAKKEAQIILADIAQLWRKNSREELARQLTTAQAAGDKTKENEILKLIMDLT